MRLIRTLVALSLILLCSPAFALDCSGTITSGGTAQTIFSSNTTRRVMLMNNSANLMCVSFTGGSPASIAGTNCAAGSYMLQPGSTTLAGGSYTNPPDIAVNTVSIISSGTGDRYSCERQ